MEKVTVPQFIDNEDKILGPITVRQFVILLVAALLIFIAFKTSDFSLFVFLSVFIAAIAGIFAFYRINGQPFHFFALHILQTVERPSVRIWKKDVHRSDVLIERRNRQIIMEDILGGEKKEEQKIHLSEQRLSELALVVDTGGGYRPEGEEGTELF